MTSPASSTPSTTSSLLTAIELRQAELGVTDQQLCHAQGIESLVTLTMIKAGTVKLPLKMIPALAAKLEMGSAELLTDALTELAPELLTVIEDVYGPARITAGSGCQRKWGLKPSHRSARDSNVLVQRIPAQ